MRSGQPVCLAEWTCCSTSHFAKCLSRPGRRMFPVSAGRSMALSFASSVMPHDTLASGSHDHSAPPAPASRRRRSRAAELPQGDATFLLGDMDVEQRGLFAAARSDDANGTKLPTRYVCSMSLMRREALEMLILSSSGCDPRRS